MTTIKNKKKEFPAIIKNALFAVSVAIFLLAGNVTNATSELVDIEQLQGGEYFGAPAICQSFIPTKANLTRIEWNINGAPNRLFNLCRGTMGQLTAGCSGADLVASSSGANAVIFNPYLDITVGANYYFCIYPQGAEIAELHNFGSGGCSAGYPYGCYYYNNTSANYYDLKFKTYYNTNFIEFEYPTDATTTPDFNNWVIRYEGGEIGVPYSISLAYGTSTALGFTDSAMVGQFSGFVQWSMEKMNALPNGRYYAIATLNKIVDYTPIPIASTSIITFIISDSAPDTYFNFNLFKLKPPVDICAGIATTTILGGLECGLKRAGVWLFYPNATTLQNGLNSIDNFKGTFPFSAFFDITDTIKHAIASTTIDDAGFYVPTITSTSTFVMMPALGTSTISNAIGNNNANLIRTGISFIMWLCAIMIIYFTIR